MRHGTQPEIVGGLRVSSYEEYTELLSLYQSLTDFQEITQATPLEVTEESFSENNLLAVEVQREGAPAFDCEFAGIDMDVDGVKATLIESGLGSSTADKKGFIFFVLVPKNKVVGDYPYNCHASKRTLNCEQTELLVRIRKMLSGKDIDTLDSIITYFAP